MKRFLRILVVYFSIVFSFSILTVSICNQIPSVYNLNGDWTINAYGASVAVHLTAPDTVVTMTEVWFNASAQVVALDDEFPYNARYVYIYNLSYFLQTPLGSLSTGTNSNSANMTVGSVRTVRNHVILSAASCGLLPGESIVLTYHIGVEMGVEVENGTIYYLQRDLQYPFQVIAGQDALESLRRQQSWYQYLGLSVFILIVIIIAYYGYKKK